MKTENTVLDARDSQTDPLIPVIMASINLSEVYLLKYKDRGYVAETHFIFKSIGDARQNKLAAIKRAQDFCDRTRMRFVHCEPFLTDLEAMEIRMAI